MSCSSYLDVFEMGCRRLYSCFFMGCFLQDLFDTARSILMQLPSRFLSIRSVGVYEVHPYSSIDTTVAWKKLSFILSDRSDFHMTDSLSIAVHVFACRVLKSFWAGEARSNRRKRKQKERKKKDFFFIR